MEDRERRETGRASERERGKERERRSERINGNVGEDWRQRGVFPI